jgi:hypothetical protein
MVPVPSSVSLVGKAVTTPTILKVDYFDAHRQTEPVSPLSSDEETAPKRNYATVAPDSPTKKGRRSSKMARFSELETIKSKTVVAITPNPPSPESVKEKRRPTTMTTALPIDFDESALSMTKEIVLPAAPVQPSKPGKLSKSAAPGPKLVKKNRWSLRSSKNTAVAV